MTRTQVLASSPQPPATSRPLTPRWVAQRAAVAAILCGVSGVAAAQDDFKLIKVEQDVRNLERQVYELNRELDELKRQADANAGVPRAARTPSSRQSTQWVSAASWDRLRVGMEEFQVLEILGPPTQMRSEGVTRTLLYALEIGSSGFLTGSVTLQDKKVTQVERPTLR